MRYTLNTVIPAFILVAGIVASGILAVVNARLELSEARREQTRITKMLGSVIAVELAEALRKGEPGAAQRALDRLKFDRRLALALYVDEDGTVLNSTNYALGLSTWHGTQFDAIAEEIERARKKHLGHVATDAALENVYAIFPIIQSPGPGEVASNRTGLLLIHRDIAREKSHLLYVNYRRFALMTTIVLAMSLAVWLFLRVVFLSPIQHLVSTLETTDPTRLPEVRPDSEPDEISRITQAFFRLSTRVRDQTDALRASEARFRNTFEHAAVGIAHVSLEGHWLRVNRKLCEITGYSEAELLARRFQDITHPEDVTRDVGRMMDVLSDRQSDTYEIEKRYISKHGDVVWVSVTVSLLRDKTGAPDYFVSVISDISARKRAEQERERFVQAVEQSSDAIVITDVRPRIVYVNAAYERITGYAREDVLGLDPGHRRSDEHDLAYYDAMWRRLQTGATWEGQIVNRRKDGGRSIEHMSITPVLDSDGQCVNYVAVSRDISDAIALEAEKRQLEEANQRSQKLEALGTLAGGIAHDFNNVLAIISGYSDMASLALDLDDPVQTELRHIKSATDRAASLVSKILLFSRRADEQREIICVATAVEEALALLRAAVPATIAIDLRVDAPDACIEADPTQLNQVIMNLVSNARHAIDTSHGTITLEVVTRELDGAEATKRQLPPGRYVQLAVSDTGSGMDGETMERIFEPFYTTKPPEKGTGLGLATVHGIVASHGGDIGVTSTPGAGTTFEILLPETQEAASSVPQQLASPAHDAGTERLLVVDDEPAIVALNQRLLEMAGYQVTGLVDSEEALQHLRDHPNDVDLLIADYTMPKMTGFELVRRIRGLGLNLPVLILTGYSEVTAPEELGALGHTKILGKPLSREKLLTAVREAFDRAQSG